jgi:RimJ/RimL family protein N-acetyltransferase
MGPELLMPGPAWLQANRPEVARIKAQIRSTNEASIAAFTAARYRHRGEYYVRDLRNDATRTH